MPTLKMLRRIYFLPTSILETFYYKIVIPSVLYGIVIWGSGSNFKYLEIIHIRAARLIHKLPNSFKDSDILSKGGEIRDTKILNLSRNIVSLQVFVDVSLFSPCTINLSRNKNICCGLKECSALIG